MWFKAWNENKVLRGHSDASMQYPLRNQFIKIKVPFKQQR